MKMFSFSLLISTLIMPFVIYAGEGGCFPKLPTLPACTKNCETNGCCSGMGGVDYCDKSAGRLVCANGFYSSCYCSAHAVMDLQMVQGCCLWHGGVMAITPENIIVCRDGSFSELCSILRTKKQFAAY